MAERARNGAHKTSTARVTTFGTAAVSARHQLSWLWSRESLLRLALSFVLALALWLYITGKQDPSLAQDFPQPLQLETANLPNGLSEISSPSTVRVRYRSDAPGAIVTAINFHPFIDLKGMSAGPPRYVPVQVVPDPGLHVVQVSPARVLVTLDRNENRAIPLTTTIVASTPAGFTVGTIRLTPSTIQLQGPESVVSLVSSAAVDIDLSGVTSTLDNTYKPVLRDSQGVPLEGSSRITVDPPQVQVHIPVTALSSLKSLPVLVPLRGQVRSGFGVTSITVAPEEITAQGSPSILNHISAVWTAPIRLNGRKAGWSVHVPLEMPNGSTSSTRSAVVTIGVAAIKS